MEKRCIMCGAVEATEVETGIVLCGACEAARQENLKTNNVIDVDFEAVEAETAEVAKEEGVQVQMKAIIMCGLAEDNQIVFDVNGTDPNLMILKGLAEYANRRIDQMYSEKEYQAAMAQQQAMKEAEEAQAAQ